MCADDRRYHVYVHKIRLYDEPDLCYFVSPCASLMSLSIMFIIINIFYIIFQCFLPWHIIFVIVNMLINTYINKMFRKCYLYSSDFFLYHNQQCTTKHKGYKASPYLFLSVLWIVSSTICLPAYSHCLAGKPWVSRRQNSVTKANISERSPKPSLLLSSVILPDMSSHSFTRTN